ncbi:Efflux pump periplasmic linker BepF [Sporomusa carbonis]|uniref:efflux RND transporter periplasmic adaptor subunit n=1 Tax=Sporomusa carbonis TaxID=3076075 RepID=UPI003A6E1DD5
MDIRGLFLAEKKKWLLVGIAAIAVAVAAFMQLANAKTQNTATGKPDSVKPVVEVKTLQRSDMVKKISLVGQTVPAAQVDIVAKYSGHVVQVNAELGQQVSSGQLLIMQDVGDVDLAIAQADAGRREAEADAAETSVTFDANYNKALVDYQRNLAGYERYKSLYEQGAVSRETFDTAEQQMLNSKATLDSFAKQSSEGTVPAAVEAKRAAVLKTERNIEALAKQREDMIIRAPRDGVIGYRQVEVGAFVQPGQKLLSIIDNSSIYVDCQVSEQDIAAIQVGLNADLQVESLGRTYSGKVIYVSPASDSKTQSFTVRLALTNPDSLIKSGMFIRSQLEVLQRPRTLFVPKEAVLEKNGEYSVYLINGSNKVEQRNVKIGLRNDKDVEILSGIKEGDQVAVSNLSRLKPGMEVTPNVLAGDRSSPEQGGKR